eukprot:GHVS01072329.1.p1 GENE.GHVS01072329.1~~GHVS01072329.1.p1  ORF type:complete len:897 (-),score=143.49 GHVS01072329.1:185-2875(-)
MALPLWHYHYYHYGTTTTTTTMTSPPPSPPPSARRRDWRSLNSLSHLRWALARVVRLDTHCILSLPIFFSLISFLLVELFLYLAVKLSVKLCEEAYFRCITKVVVGCRGGRAPHTTTSSSSSALWGECAGEDRRARGGGKPKRYESAEKKVVGGNEQVCAVGNNGYKTRKGSSPTNQQTKHTRTSQFYSSGAVVGGVTSPTPVRQQHRRRSPTTSTRRPASASSLFSFLSYILPTPSGLISLRSLKRRMLRCTTYPRYLECVEELDFVTGRTEWKDQLSSSSYDYQSVAKRKELLQYRRLSGDVPGLVAVLRTCVHGQFGGILRESLYCRTFSGTKRLVQEYVDEVCVCLHYLQGFVGDAGERGGPTTGFGNSGDAVVDDADNVDTNVQHIDFIQQQHQPISTPRTSMSSSRTTTNTTQQHSNNGSRSSSIYYDDLIRSMLHDGTCQWGCTALILSGGAMLGVHHFGLCETLLKERVENTRRCLRRGGWRADDGSSYWSDTVMPNVVCGTSAGSAVAAWLCTRTEDELLQENNSEYISKAFAALKPNNWFRRLWRIMRVGYMCDVAHWTKVARRLYGDMTFLEAYEKTGKVLNICMTRAEGGGTLLLHYKNAPNVVIYSAVLCSSSFPFLAYPLHLKEKCDDGELVESCEFEGSFYHDGSLSGDIPIAQLRECWGVTFTIVSQVNPHIFPFCGLRAHGEAGVPVAWRGATGKWRAGFIMSGLELFFKENMRFLLRLIALLDVSPTYRGINCGALALQSYGGDVTIHPRSLSWRHYRLGNDLTESEVEWFIQEGRIMTYPKMAIIINRMRIERALERLHLAAFEPLFADAALPPIDDRATPKKGSDAIGCTYSVVEQRTFQLLGRLYNYKASQATTPANKRGTQTARNFIKQEEDTI